MRLRGDIADFFEQHFPFLIWHFKIITFMPWLMTCYLMREVERTMFANSFPF